MYNIIWFLKVTFLQFFKEILIGEIKEIKYKGFER